MTRNWHNLLDPDCKARDGLLAQRLKQTRCMGTANPVAQLDTSINKLVAQPNQDELIFSVIT